MILKNISIGGIKPKAFYLELLQEALENHTSLSLEILGPYEFSLNSKEQNKVIMKRDDKRRSSLGRDYLFTSRIRPDQLEEFKSFISKANLMLDFEEPLEAGIKFADAKVEE